MKSRPFIQFLVVALLVAGLCSTAWGTGFQAGAAAVDITPDVNKYKVNSIGYFSQKVMTSVHDPIMCKTLAVTDGAETAAIVTCDLMGTPPALRQKVLDLLAGTGIDDHNLMMAMSHTHSGPGNMMPNLIARIGFGGYNEEITQQTAEKIAASMKRALADMRPATLNFAETELDGVTMNRRDPAGSYNYDTRRFSDAYDPQNPANRADPTLSVIRIDDESGAVIAVLFHFATHGTVLGPEYLSLSADWPGVSQARIEEAMPGAVAMYMNGAQGDQAPAMRPDDNDDLAYLDIIGGQVADGVFGIIGRAQPVAATPVRALMVRREAPPGNSMLGYRVPRALVKHYFPELPLQVVRMGDVVLMAIPVEMVTEGGQAMKQAALGQGAAHPLVVGLANDHLLYTATPEDFERGGYEVDNTALGKVEAGIIIGEEILLVRQVLREN